MTKPSVVAIVNMPFAPADRPSIQVGILRALLTDANIDARELHANLDFYDLLRRHDVHEPYCSTLPGAVAEWFFSRETPFGSDDVIATFPDGDSPRKRLEEFGARWGATTDDLLEVREFLVPNFMNEILDDNDWSDVGVVAFTVTYPQINASIWLAEELKKRHPHIRTVFGGAMSLIHVDAACAYLEAFDAVDVVVVGEAEPVFADICRDLLDDKAPQNLLYAGTYVRTADGTPAALEPMAIAQNMSIVPFPDYRGFLEKRASLPDETQALIVQDVLIEMSRGCAWAVKNVCTFCGFYPDGGFRPKSFQRLLDEFRAQRETTGYSSFFVVDAYVTRAMINGLFKQLPREEPGLVFPFVELKSDITREQVTLLAKAGTHLVQPGVECLNDGLLEKIHKGVTLFDNVLLLKWCREDSVAVSYNIILGLPDATDDELRDQLDVIKRLTHLSPPAAITLSIVRASGYHLHPERYGLTNLRPDPFYGVLFPKRVDIDRVAFDFISDLDGVALHQARTDETAEAIHYWRQDWGAVFKKPTLTIDETEDGVVVVDGRNLLQSDINYTFTGDEAAVIRAIVDQPLSDADIASETGVGRQHVKRVLQDLDDKRLTIESRGRVLALPTRVTKSAPRRLIGDLRRRRLSILQPQS